MCHGPCGRMSCLGGHVGAVAYRDVPLPPERLAKRFDRGEMVGRLAYSFSVRKRSALTMTDTELSDIASAAMIGLRSRPKVG